MRIAKLTAVAAFALAAAACNTEAGNDVSTDVNLAEDAAANDVLGVNATGNAASSTPTDAAGFANAVAAADLYEVESARLAADKATSADVKSLAQHIRTDHEKSTSELKSAAGTANISVAPKLDAEKQGMIDQLKAAARGAEFDRLFLEQQKTAHQKALTLLQDYASGGDNEALKAFAAKTAAAVKGHLDHANSIRL
jgi:putative membrane protein